MQAASEITMTNYRKERIERLLNELRYEISRGMMDREIEEEMGFRFFVPISHVIKNGLVMCEFRTRPVPQHYYYGAHAEPRLRIVK